MRTHKVDITEEMYDQICGLLTDYEEGEYDEADMYEVLCDIANLYANAEEEGES